MFLYDNLGEKDGRLTFAGIDTVTLAEKYSTPLYVLDEDRIRLRMRTYISAVKKYFNNASVLYASKALSFKGIYKIAAEEKMCIDVVSGGELWTAKEAGFPIENAFFHGNNKTDEEIEFAISSGIGYFVVDSTEELNKIDEISLKYNKKQKILFRLTPNIDPHTHKSISTGKIDSKFGFAIMNGQADEIIEKALKCENVDFVGIHAHIGSQIFDSKPFCDCASILLDYMAEIKKKYKKNLEILNLGGGFGVPYVETQPQLDIEKYIAEISCVIKEKCKKLSLSEPKILFEPGRSIVADSGITLYKVGCVKKIKGYKNYIAIDGGMTDNPRYALYKSVYTVLNASRVNAKKNFKATIVGKCCESGDIIQKNVKITEPIKDEILAVLTTGAYNYSMSSNYNRLLKPAVVSISEKKDKLVVKRETYQDLLRNDL